MYTLAGLGDVCNGQDDDFDQSMCLENGGTVINPPAVQTAVQTCRQAGLPDFCPNGSVCSLGLWPDSQGCPPPQAAPTAPAPTHAAAPAAAASSGGYNVNAAQGQSNTGFSPVAPQVPLAPANALTPSANSIATSLSLPTTIPNWVFYVAGGVFVLGIGFLIYKRKRPGAFDGYEDAEDDGDEDDDDLGE
jgi:hypothetical protein